MDVFTAAEAGQVVLDGGLATQLEAQGCDLSSALWSARLLADEPQQIYAAHRAFFAAGAQVAITSSYQASFAGFTAVGIDRAQAITLMRRSVELARRAAADEPPTSGGDVAAGPNRHLDTTVAPAGPNQHTDASVGREAGPDRRWIAASVGPYGAVLGDGSEYRGDYGLSLAELRAFHHERLAVLVDAGADLLAVETIPSLLEIEALVAELDLLGVPAWISITADGTRTRAGDAAEEAFAMAASGATVGAVGVNCTDPKDIDRLLALAATVTAKPLVVYPNSGEEWDAIERRWRGPAAFEPVDVKRWRELGARLVGGCCRVTPAQIRALAASARGNQATRTPASRRPARPPIRP